MSERKSKGFTLAELLIVVAIIGVLVAISIPIFTSQLEKSRDAVTLSNIRAAYAEVQAAYLTQDTSATSNQTITQNGQTITIKPATSNGTQEITISDVVAKGQADGLANTDQLPCTVKDKALDAMGKTPGSYTLKFTYTTKDENTTVELTEATATKAPETTKATKD